MKPIIIAAALMLLAGSAAAGSGGYGTGEGNPHKTGRISALSFEDMDTDKNGTVSLKEFQTQFPRITEAGFGRLDTDGNGELSQKEWEAFQEMHKGMGMGGTSKS